MSKDNEDSENSVEEPDTSEVVAPADAADSAEATDAPVETETVDDDGAGIAPPRTSGGTRWLAVFALLVALGSASLAGFLWWQSRLFYVTLDEADDSSLAALRQARTEIVSLEDRLDDLRREDGNLSSALGVLRQDLELLPPRLVGFEERLQGLQGVSEDSRRAWLRAEIQYLLSLANMELSLAGRWDTATQALTLADGKLRELANPSLTPVRDAIADALQRLNAVPLADIEGMSLALGNLAARVDELPLKASAERSEFDSTPADIDAPPGFERAWASFKVAVGGLVRIDRRDVPVRRALTIREEALLRLSLELELEAARLSLLRADGAGFQMSLATAQRSLIAEFDAGDGGVEAALAAVANLTEVSIDPPRPDISQPLTLMRRLTGMPVGEFTDLGIAPETGDELDAAPVLDEEL
jgi:uroporphyrin-3 C-methyltransferase